VNVVLIAHTQLSAEFSAANALTADATDGAAVALTAIRTCYSPLKPSAIVATEGAKYFGSAASDGGEGTEADRLIRHIVRSKHLSTLESLNFTFAIEGVSRSLLAQLTRHRVGFSFSVQSQRYVKFGSGDKSGGFDYVTPPSLDGKTTDTRRLTGFDEDAPEGSRSIFTDVSATDIFDEAMRDIQAVYDRLRRAGVPAEDARYVLPNAATTNLVMTANLRSLLDFYEKRKQGNGAQWEIAELAELLREKVAEVEPWADAFFGDKTEGVAE
jgi:thymidylate synthase (FAD)